MNLKFQIFDSLWWRYNLILNLEDVHISEAIIEYVLDNLDVTLKSLNLVVQSEYLEKVKKEFFIHDLTFEQILTTTEDNTIFICRHTNNKNIDLFRK